MVAEAKARIAIENGVIGGHHETTQGPYCKSSPRPGCVPNQDNANLLISTAGIVPYLQNRRFVGREQLSKELSSRLHIRENSQARLALFGLGGVGLVSVRSSVS